MNVWDKIKLARAFSKLSDRLQKEFRMGHLKPALFGLGAAAVLAIVTKASADCPCLMDILKAWPSYLTSGVMAGIGVYLKSPASTAADDVRDKAAAKELRDKV